MAKIGIFWYYKNTVIGRTREISDGEENITGILDVSDTHHELWEHDPTFHIPFHELRIIEYQDVPRGRVVYSKTMKKAIIYLDKALLKNDPKIAILDFFELNETSVIWKPDSHYTTDPSELGLLFDD